MEKLSITLEQTQKIRRIVTEGGGDEVMLADMVEGETDLFAWIDYFLNKEAEENTIQTAIDDRIEALEARKTSSKSRTARFRDCLMVCLKASGKRSQRRPEATLSLKAVPPGIASIDEALLPDEYFVTKRELSRDKIRLALANGVEVPGVTMSNGGETMSIRR